MTLIDKISDLFFLMLYLGYLNKFDLYNNSREIRWKNKKDLKNQWRNKELSL